MKDDIYYNLIICNDCRSIYVFDHLHTPTQCSMLCPICDKVHVFTMHKINSDIEKSLSFYYSYIPVTIKSVFTDTNNETVYGENRYSSVIRLESFTSEELLNIYSLIGDYI